MIKLYLTVYSLVQQVPVLHDCAKVWEAAGLMIGICALCLYELPAVVNEGTPMSQQFQSNFCVIVWGEPEPYWSPRPLVGKLHA